MAVVELEGIAGQRRVPRADRRSGQKTIFKVKGIEMCVVLDVLQPETQRQALLGRRTTVRVPLSTLDFCSLGWKVRVCFLEWKVLPCIEGAWKAHGRCAANQLKRGNQLERELAAGRVVSGGRQVLVVLASLESRCCNISKG